jgi:S-formylglutathione hydrolase FrmB
LLHGYDGDETSWLDRCELQQITDSLILAHALPEIVIVMPEAHNSYYINDYRNQFPYNDYFLYEFIPTIDSMFRVSDEKNDRAICGLSMGGFGAVIIPVKNPGLFGTSISLSAAVRNNEIIKTLTTEKYQQYFGDIFGDSLVGNERITEHWKQNSPYYIIDSLYSIKLQSVNWYIDCGMQDYHYMANKAFHELLFRYNIPHEYHMRQGEHNWTYWRKGFINGMVYWGNLLNL